MMHAFVLLFVICSAAAPNDCEGGSVLAGNCAAAEAYIRAGLQPGQTITILDCARRT